MQQLDEDDSDRGKVIILNSKLAVIFTVRKFAKIFKITVFCRNNTDKSVKLNFENHHENCDFQRKNNDFRKNQDGIKF